MRFTLRHSGAARSRLRALVAIMVLAMVADPTRRGDDVVDAACWRHNPFDDRSPTSVH